MREIPNTATEIQEGLWLNVTPFTVGGVTYEQRELYSSYGYCFYDKTAEIYDEEGNLIPNDEVLPSQRLYMQYASLGLNTDIENFVSVPVDTSYDNVTA